MSFEQLLSLGLFVAGITHFGVLLAGVQAPKQLNWAEEVPRMSRFNQKILIVYYLFTGVTIVMFGSLTLYLRDEILDKDPVASLLALAIGVWWTARILVDIFIFDHKDWPEGKKYIVGHVVLTSGFVGMAGVMLTAGVNGLGWL